MLSRDNGQAITERSEDANDAVDLNDAKAGGQLVEQQQLRTCRDGGSELHESAVSVRQICHAVRELVAEPKKLEKIVDRLAGRASASTAPSKSEVVDNGEAVAHSRVLPGPRNAESSSSVGRKPGDVASAEPHDAGSGANRTGNDVK